MRKWKRNHQLDILPYFPQLKPTALLYNATLYPRIKQRRIKPESLTREVTKWAIVIMFMGGLWRKNWRWRGFIKVLVKTVEIFMHKFDLKMNSYSRRNVRQCKTRRFLIPKLNVRVIFVTIFFWFIPRFSYVFISSSIYLQSEDVKDEMKTAKWRRWRWNENHFYGNWFSVAVRYGIHYCVVYM